MADRYELAFLKNALGVNLLVDLQEQTALINAMCQRLFTGNFTVDQSGVVSVTSLAFPTLAAHSVLVGEGTAPLGVIAPGTAGAPLVGRGASADPAFIQPAAMQWQVGTVAMLGPNKMYGFGVSIAITPTTSGRLCVTLTGYATGGGGQAADSMQLYLGSGTAPANGAALTGMPLGQETLLSLSSAATTTIAMSGLTTGLTVGVPYWIDVALVKNPSATVSVTANLIATEF